ncbi:MAG: DUF2062 domain-containing protein [Desulfopila sp.]
MKPARLSRYYFLRLQRLKGDPKFLAGGFAIGVFVGLTPTMPFHTVLILLATLTTRTSAIAGILSSWLVCNPFTSIPIYYIALVVGNKVTPYYLDWQKLRLVVETIHASHNLRQSLDALAGLSYQATVVMLVGGCLVAFPFALASYYLALKFFSTMKKRRARKQHLGS